MITCGCDFEPTLGQWWWEGYCRIKQPLKVSCRCKSCGIKIKPGEETTAINRYRWAASEIEERICGEDVPLANWYYCDECATALKMLSKQCVMCDWDENLIDQIAEYMEDGGCGYDAENEEAERFVFIALSGWLFGSEFKENNMENTFDLEQFKQGIPAYTRDGLKATFVGVCNECQPDHQLIVHIEGGARTLSLLLTGELTSTECQSLVDLVRMKSPYDHIKKGELVMVWNDSQSYKSARLRKFAGCNGERALVFSLNTLTKCPLIWDNCLTAEEYAEKYL